jgi:hypothetical protein
LANATDINTLQGTNLSQETLEQLVNSPQLRITNLQNSKEVIGIIKDNAPYKDNVTIPGVCI